MVLTQVLEEEQKSSRSTSEQAKIKDGRVVLVRKKNGEVERFNREKVINAASKALLNAGETTAPALLHGEDVADIVWTQVCQHHEVSFELIHNLVELALMDINKHAAKAYITYRLNRKLYKESKDNLVDAIRNVTVEHDKDNANTLLSPASKMLQISEAANKFYVLNYILPQDIAEAHKAGKIYIHDLSYYLHTYNCLNFSASKLLKAGLKMPHGTIRPPKSFGVACELTAIALQSAANSQFGISA